MQHIIDIPNQAIGIILLPQVPPLLHPEIPGYSAIKLSLLRLKTKNKKKKRVECAEVFSTWSWKEALLSPNNQNDQTEFSALQFVFRFLSSLPQRHPRIARETVTLMVGLHPSHYLVIGAGI